MSEHIRSESRAAVLAPLKRSAGWIAFLAVVGAVVGGVLGYLRSDAYVATASILVTPLTGNAFSPGGRGDDLVNLNTEAQLVASDDVASAVADAAGPSVTATDVLSGLSVTVPTNTQVLTISYRAGSRLVAVERAQAFAEEFLAFREARAASAADERVQRLESQLSDTNDELAGYVADLATASASRRQLLAERIDGITAYVVVLQTQLTDARTASTYPGQIVTPGTTTSSRSLMTPLVFAVGGALAGMLGGLLIALARARRDNRVRDAEDVAAVGPRLVATIPGRETAGLLALDSPSTVAEATLPDGCRRLRAAVLVHSAQRPVRLMVADAGTADSPPVVGLGLGLAFARSGLRTLLVDAAGGSSSATAMLGLASCPGLTEVLQHRVEVDGAVVPLTTHLDLIPVGGSTEALSDSLASPAMTALTDKLAAERDAVIVLSDSLQESHAQELASLVGTVVLQVTQGSVTYAEMAAISEQVLGAELLGTAFVEQARRRTGRRAS